LLILLAEWNLAEGAVLCVPKTGVGAVRMRPACRANEIPLDPAAVGVRGPGAVVIDATGAIVGPIAEVGGDPPVEGLRQTGTSAVLVPVNSAGLVQNGIPLYFESADCSGPAFSQFAPPSSTELVHRGYVTRTTVYYHLAAQVTINEQSYFFEPVPTPLSCNGIFIPPAGCCMRSGSTIVRTPLGTLDLSDLVPPFRVKVEP